MDHQGAIDDYSKTIELDPENPEIYIKRGDVKLHRKVCDYQGAIDDYSKALELTNYETDKAEILALRSKAHQMLSEIKNPKDPQTFIYRAERKIFLKDYQGAIDDYSKALELTTHETDKKEILELRSKAYQKLSKIDLDRSQSL